MAASVDEGRLATLFNSEIVNIDEGSVRVKTPDGERDLPNDHVFVFIGGELPTPFLKRIGVEYTRKFGER